jgi:hypothetical protein
MTPERAAWWGRLVGSGLFGLLCLVALAVGMTLMAILLGWAYRIARWAGGW